MDGPAPAKRASSHEAAAISLTFLIADIRGYTAFTREHGDQAAAHLAQRFAQLAREAAAARSGEVIELRGDEALAVFESPAQGIRAGAELLQACAEETEADPTLPLTVGVGIDQGEAVPVEGGYRGAALNTAARLCARAGAGELLLTRGVAEAAGDVEGLVLEGRGALELKGFVAPVEVLQVVPVGTLPLAAFPEAVIPEPLPPELDPAVPLVGREGELNWLRGTWRLGRRGRGRVLFVSGPQGIGKTRLLAELAAQVHGEGARVVYAGPGGAGSALALRAIREAAEATTPTLVLIDDLEVLGEGVIEALAEALPGVEGRRRALVGGAFRDVGAHPALASLVEGVDHRGDGHRILSPLDAVSVGEIARLYAGKDLTGVPLESFLGASGGVPARVHEQISDWARDEAGRRLVAAAEYLAAGRTRQAGELSFANNVITLRLARLYAPEGGEADLCPYKGLASFGPEDASYFFGRERLVGELAARTVGVGLLAVVGPSGSGKSSVVLGGLLPSLDAGLLPGSGRWRHVVIRPGEHPLAELERALGASPGLDRRLVLVVDQFEELFTVTSPGEAGPFVEGLLHAAEDPERAVVVPTIRADFYGHLATYPQLAELVGQNHVLVPPMSPEELRRAIVLPARRVGLRVESGLTEALVEEVAEEPGGLPLLSSALVELWQAREEGWLRVEAHERTGGVRGAVGRLAEASFGQLSQVEREAARRILLRLVGEGEGETAVRRRVPTSEFDLDRDSTSAAVLDRLTRDRLLTASEEWVEVAHEALLREWPRLRAWLEEDTEGRRLRSHLTRAARAWAEAGREASELYRGPRLSATLDWAATHAVELNELERSFLGESRQASEREAERQRRTNRRLRGLLAGVALFLVLALVAGGLALAQRGNARREATRAEQEATRAEQQARIATARELAAAAAAQLQIDPELSLLLALEAVETTRATDGTVIPEAEQALHDAINTTRLALSVPGGFGVAFSPADDRLATNREDGTVTVWDSATGEQLLTLSGHMERVMNLIFSFDGRKIATGSEDRTAKIWDADTGEEVLTLEGHEDFATSPAFSFDGEFLAVTGFDGTTRVWDTSTGAQRLKLENSGLGLAFSPVENLLLTAGTPATLWDIPSGTPRLRLGTEVADTAFSPDGGLVAYGESTDRTARVVNVETGEELMKLSGHELPVEALDFSPDGTRLATSSIDGTVRIWDLTTGEALLVLSGQGASVDNVDFNRDGTLVVGGSSAGTALVWDVRPEGSREVLTTVVGPPAPFYLVGYSPDGTRFVSGSFEGTPKIFDAPTGREILALPNGPPVGHAIFGPGGTRVATGDEAGNVKLWDAASGEELLVIPAHEAPVTSVNFSPDGTRLVTTGVDGVVKVWHPETGRLELSLAPELHVALGATFSPDGSRLASTHQDDRAKLWDARSGEDLATMEHAHTVFGVAFSPDGSIVATGSADGKVILWDGETGTEILRLEGHEAGVFGVAFSPDGKLVASSSDDRTVRLWDVATGEEVLRLIGHSQPVNSVAFSPDGKRLLSASADGAARIYTLDIEELIELARARLTRGFNDPECRTYLHLERCPAEES